MSNIAYIDGQNLYLSTSKSDNPWHIDFGKFRIYLKDKYRVEKAYYFLGYVNEEYNDLYQKLQESGFIVLFKKQTAGMRTTKKGNVDTDIVFHIMAKLVDDPQGFEKLVLISGDGDYKQLVDYLIKKRKFEKILFLNKKYASSPYKELGGESFDYLENIRKYIEYRKK